VLDRLSSDEVENIDVCEVVDIDRFLVRSS